MARAVTPTIKQVVKPVQRTPVKRANTIAKRQATLKTQLASKKAANLRTTARKTAAKPAVSKSVQIKQDAAQRRRQALLKQAIAKKKSQTLKTKKNSLAKTAKAKEILKDRAAKVNAARKATEANRRDALRSSAMLYKKVKEVRVENHTTQMGHANAAKTIKSDSTSASLDIKGVSSKRAITESTKPTSRPANTSAQTNMLAKKNTMDKVS
jgi:hypothetical protein